MPLMDCGAPITMLIPNVVFDDATVTETAAGNPVAMPAIEATWDVPTDVDVVAIQFEYLPAAGGAAILTPPQDAVGSQHWLTTDGILPETTYNVRWRAVGRKIDAYPQAWSSYTAVTTLSVLTSDRLFEMLRKIKVNLWKYEVFSVTGGATAVDPFTAWGEQDRAFTIPGGSATPRVQVLNRQAGLATRDGAAYNFSYKGAIDSGTGTLRARWRDAASGAITGISDQSWTITTTPTTITWEHIASDDPDFAEPIPNTSYFEFFVSNTTDIPAGRTVTISELQLQTDSYLDPQPIVLPWRPAPRDGHNLNYAEYIAELYAAEGLTTLGLAYATSVEVGAGTEAAKMVSPDALAGSTFGKRVVGVLVTDPNGDAITVGDGKAYFRIPSALNGMNLVEVAACLDTLSTSGIPTVQLRRKRAGTDIDMLSTKLTVDASETDSSSAATAAVINATNDDVATGDRIYFDCDVAGTGAKGLYVEMTFQLP